jgi:Kef-type K+ transport system membrane component KefB
MVQEVVTSISIIIGVAALITILARAIKQPPIIAYLVAGILVGPLFLGIIGPSTDSTEIINVFAHVGVALLLFMVGLHLDFRVLKEVGGVASIAGILEIIITSTIGFLLAIGLGMSNTIALYIGIALAFSSTVVVVKILSDKKEIDSLHGKIALGILIVEDFVAAIALMAIPIIHKGGDLTFILQKIGMVIVLITAILVGSTILIHRFLNYLARSQETLFLFGIAWALVIATAFDYLGFSLEIGALVAGMALASSKYSLELSGKIKPLRDFFIVLFFVFFGAQLAGDITSTLIYQAAIFSTFVILGKPIIIMTILRFSGYKKRTNFFTGSSLAQISEFSLILILLGFTLGALPQETMSLIVLISIITIGISSYNIYYSHAIFNKISKFLNIFENKKNRLETVNTNTHYEIVLFGYHRIGAKLLKTIKKMKKPFVVIDYNPRMILELNKQGIPAIYGDAGDSEFLNELGIEHAKMLISTLPSSSVNLMIKDKIKSTQSRATFIATAERSTTALELYGEGVDYVLIPQHLGGDYAAYLLDKYGTEKGKFEARGESHKKELHEQQKKQLFSF